MVEEEALVDDRVSTMKEMIILPVTIDMIYKAIKKVDIVEMIKEAITLDETTIKDVK